MRLTSKIAWALLQEFDLLTLFSFIMGIYDENTDTFKWLAATQVLLFIHCFKII
jgi:hypothetical protein